MVINDMEPMDMKSSYDVENNAKNGGKQVV